MSAATSAARPSDGLLPSLKTSTKAALLSGLVCPGAGQLYLRRYAVAAVLIVVTAGSLLALLMPAIATANAIAERIVSGELTIGPDLLGEVTIASAEAGASSGPATLALLAAWLVGIVHAWSVGRQRDQR